MSRETCQNCQLWIRSQDKTEPNTSRYGQLFGKCLSLHFIYVKHDQPVKQDDLAYWDAEGYATGLRTGQGFGCIHFEGRG